MTMQGGNQGAATAQAGGNQQVGEGIDPQTVAGGATTATMSATASQTGCIIKPRERLVEIVDVSQKTHDKSKSSSDASESNEEDNDNEMGLMNAESDSGCKIKLTVAKEKHHSCMSDLMDNGDT